MKKVISSIAAILLFAAGTAQADIAVSGAIASWNQQGQPGNQVSTSGTGSSHITATAMTRGAGLGVNAGANSLNSNGWNGQSTDYVQFGFMVDQGYHATLGNLYFGSKVSKTGPATLEIRTSSDNYSTAFQTITMNNSVSGTPYINNIVNLSSLATVAGGSTFSIRLYGTGATSGSGTMRVGAYSDGDAYYFDSITGNVAADASPTPIPAAAWLFGSGLLGLAGIRRRRS